MTTIPKSQSPVYSNGTPGTTNPEDSGSKTATNEQTKTAKAEDVNEAATPSMRALLDTSAVDLDFSRFDTTTPNTSGPTDPIQTKYKAATNRFQGRLDDVLNLDAMSMARGETPFQNGTALSSDQRSGLQSAAGEFLKDMPLGALAPRFGNGVRDRLNGLGVKVDNINNMSLREVGDHVGDKAGDFASETGKEWADNLKDRSPAAFYGLLASGAAAAGTVGVLAGSDGLKKVGIKPEFDTGLFNDRVTVRARAAWDPGLENFKVGGTIRGHIDTGSVGTLAASVSAEDNKFTGASLTQRLSFGNLERGADFRATATFDSAGFKEATGFAQYRLSPSTQFNGNIRFDDGGFDTASLSAITSSSTAGTLRGEATFNSSGLETLGAQYRLSRQDLNLGIAADVEHNFQTDSTTGGLSLRYQPSSSVDFALSGSLDTKGDSRIGLGMRVRF